MSVGYIFFLIESISFSGHYGNFFLMLSPNEELTFMWTTHSEGSISVHFGSLISLCMVQHWCSPLQAPHLPLVLSCGYHQNPCKCLYLSQISFVSLSSFTTLHPVLFHGFSESIIASAGHALELILKLALEISAGAFGILKNALACPV